MDSPNCPTTMPNVLPSQPLFCPWTSKAPLASSMSIRYGGKPFEQQTNCGNFQQASVNCQHARINQSCSNNQQMNSSGILNMAKPTALICPSIQQSSSQFFNFLRLMQLFPDVHPATLHTVLVLCKSDFFCAVDKLLYAKRCKQQHANRRNMMQQPTQKFSRQQSYSCTGTGIINNGQYDLEQATLTVNDEIQGPLVLQGIVNHPGPLDASVKKMQNIQCQTIKSGIKGNKSLLKAKLLEPRKILPRTRLKCRVTSAATFSTDLPSVTTMHCKLPIRPLSPVNGLPEDLSNQPTASENTR